MMKKIELLIKHAHKRKQNVKFSIALKTTVIYTAMFGLILAASVGILSWAMTVRTMHFQNLDRISSFIADRVSHEKEKEFDFDSFAKVNKIYIEMRDPRSGYVKNYGNKPSKNTHGFESLRQINVRDRQLFIKVTDCESIGLAGSITPFAFFASLLALLVLAALSGAFLMRKMMRPVYDLTRTARSISAGDLSRRIDSIHSHDELNELAETFNEMLDRIQKSYEQQNRFVSDASHELRTPLSVISGYANLLRRWGSEDREIREESIEKIVEETENMQQLVERLLFLARADQKRLNIKHEKFSISELMEEISGETRLISEDRNIISDIAQGLYLTADKALIKQAVRAVIENSLKYTPAGGDITIACRQTEGFTELSVQDTGVGISEKDIPYIFDRFYKVDESRVRGSKGSSGLGLSIVKWIVESHGGKLEAKSKYGCGTKITMLIPNTTSLPRLEQ